VPNFRFTLEYDGTGFVGWQAQADGQRTVQDEFEAAIARVTGQQLRVAAAGRTDAGVHALGQVVSAQVSTELSPLVLQRALNQSLPEDLAVVAAERAADDFHARFSAIGKLYCYRVWNASTRSPMRSARVHWVARELDVPAMAKAAEAFLGSHDFAALQAAGSDVESTVRTLERLDVEREPPGELVGSKATAFCAIWCETWLERCSRWALAGDRSNRWASCWPVGTAAGRGLPRRPQASRSCRSSTDSSGITGLYRRAGP